MAARALASSTSRRSSRVLPLLAALAGGALTQALFWRTGVGANWLVIDLVIVVTAIVLFRRTRTTPTAWAAVGIAVALGASVVVRASSWTLFLAIPLNALVLAAIPPLLGGERTLSDLASLPFEMLASVVRLPNAFVRAASVPAEAVDFGRGRGLVLGVAIGLPTAGFFALLLSADAAFTAVLARARGEAQEAILFIAFSLLTAGGWLVWHAFHAPAPEPPAARPATPYRVEGDYSFATPAKRTELVIAPVTWAAVLGQVAAVFALFVAVNAKNLFGGHALVRNTQGVTYASYLHSGFGQLLFATILSVCLVLVGHRVLRREDAAKVGGGTMMAVVESALLVLTGVALASCWQRLAIYEEAYGATYLRLGVAFIELLVLGVLALTLAKSIARGWRGHAGALVAFTVCLGAFAASFDADGYVARTNLDRAARARPLDTIYLETLSADACKVLDHPQLDATWSRPYLRDAWAATTEGRGLRAARGIFDQCQIPATSPQPK